MHINKANVPVIIDIPGATARQQTDFGDAGGYGKIAGEYLSFAKGTDLAPLLNGLENDLCQSPHWGFLIEGEVTVAYTDGSTEILKAGDLFYLPPGHTVSVQADAEMILFSPQNEHCSVLDHIQAQLANA